MLRRRTATGGSALVIGIMAICALITAPAVADPEPETADALASQALLDAIQHDLGLSADQARTRLRNEARASASEAVLRNRLGDSYGGAWVTGPASETFVVATTDASESTAITESGATPQVVKHSVAELTASKEALDRHSSTAPLSTPVWYVDVRGNRVVVLTSQPSEADAFVARSGADISLADVERSDERPRTYLDVRGGDAYYINGSSRCSVGFAITRGTTNGFVSAGHCADAGNATTGYNQAAQGTFQGSSFPGNDYSWVAVNSDWTPVPYVGSGGGNVTVRGSAVAVVGASVCRSGSTTGWHCGTVEQRDASVAYSQGTVSGVIRTNVCAEPGDSGGSFISGSQAQGVTSGGSGDCTSGGTTYFQPVNEILSAYGLTLVTG
ncbi:alpha-lytic protease prodomain-containing protein [Planotetraspora phitsanulokensis]|uniref:Serine protease n=1 Tax=Planotetraspora phitsanulokensis TaxID=575192 RepID=A0A8J3UBQ4_9ACTN|nr:S1 family peptidase [Planotetraspora phitsanulokensis]GII40692.1 serine protease [Planotetraspora phitsanulokensis]